MAIRLIGIDLDGTMLYEHVRVTEETKKAFAAAREHGILIVPSTGRAYKDMPEDVKALEKIPYFLTSNGANVLSGDTLKSVYLDLLSNEESIALLELLEKLPGQVNFHCDGYSILKEISRDQVPERLIAIGILNRPMVKSPVAYVKEHGTQAEKVYIRFHGGAIPAGVREKIAEIGDFLVTQSAPDNLEINSATASKGNGLRQLGKILGIGPEEIAVIGDSSNDISMFELAGLRIAMGNAENCIKERADYVTEDSEHDGVALAIANIINGVWK